MDKQLPIIQLMIDPGDDADTQVDCVSLVDAPAIERNFLAFSKAEEKKVMHFTSLNEEEQVVIGPAMIPDVPIYRKTDGNEYYVVFSKDTVKQIAEKFFRKGFQNNANLMHDAAQKAEGVCYFQSFIRDTAKGMTGLAGDYPEGTWFLGAKISNPDVWAKIKSGEIKGFSVEGLFQYKKEALSAQQAEEKIRSILADDSLEDEEKYTDIKRLVKNLTA